MSKEIARTVGGKWIAYLAIAAAVVVFIALNWQNVAAAEPTPTATPKPAVLSFVKSASTDAPPDGIVGFSITVENSGGTAADVHVEDQLPAGTLWHIGSDTLNCALDGPPGAQYVDCSDTVEERHVSETGDLDFVNGRGIVTLWGLSNGCGQTYRNQASMVADGIPYASNIAVARTVACATPTPVVTDTPAPALTPTSTAAVPTSTPVTPVVNAPSGSVVPLPPRTGNTQASLDPADRFSKLVTIYTCIAGALVVSLIVVQCVRRR